MWSMSVTGWVTERTTIGRFGTAELPSSLEQRQRVFRVIRMLPDFFHFELDAKAGPVRYGDVPIDDLDRVVDNHIANLRRKIEEDPAKPRYLRNVRGLGYRFDG